ncbi:hypothetical protein D3C72_1669870 [compost metagenome]
MQLALSKAGMQLDLIDSGNCIAYLHERLQMMNLKVADTDRPYTAFLKQPLQRTPGILVFRYARPVDHIQIDHFQTKRRPASFKSSQCLVIALIFVPDLRRDEQLVSVDARTPDCPSDLSFISVQRCCINASITYFQRGLNRTFHFIARRLIGSKSKTGHSHAIIQQDCIR